MHDSDQMRHCIELCQECHRVCLETIPYCLSKGGQHARPEHIRLMMDCVEICQTSANFMIRGSELHVQTCAACAEVCEKCAEDCEHMRDDQRMAECAAICRRCSESCREMAGHFAGRQ